MGELLRLYIYIYRRAAALAVVVRAGGLLFGSMAREDKGGNPVAVTACGGDL